MTLTSAEICSLPFFAVRPRRAMFILTAQRFLEAQPLHMRAMSSIGRTSASELGNTMPDARNQDRKCAYGCVYVNDVRPALIELSHAANAALFHDAHIDLHAVEIKD